MNRLHRWSLFAIAVLLALISLPGKLLAIEVLQVPVPETAVGKLIFAALIPVVGWVATKTYDGIKQLIPAYARWSPVIHAALAPLWAFALGFVASKLGLSPVSDLAGIDFAWVQGALTALTGLGIFRAEHRGENKPTTADT